MKPSAIFLSIVFLLAAVSCGKEKDNSHVPAGRVAHMTVTQHTPDTAYRLEYTFEWQDTLLECVKCLLPDGRKGCHQRPDAGRNRACRHNNGNRYHMDGIIYCRPQLCRQRACLV